MAFRPKPEHVRYQSSADIVGFRKRMKCPLIVQFAVVLWIVYGALLLIMAMIFGGDLGLQFVRFTLAAVFIGIAFTVLFGGTRGIWGYAWVSILLGWVQVLFLLIYLRQVVQERPPLINYTLILIPLALVFAGVLALAGSTRYLNWRKKRGFTKA